jgi:transcription initiation factor TFIIB
MKTIEIERCTVCKSSVIDDIQNGERICSGCGIVVSEQMEDYGPETRGSNLEDKSKFGYLSEQHASKKCFGNCFNDLPKP